MSSQPHCHPNPLDCKSLFCTGFHRPDNVSVPVRDSINYYYYYYSTTTLVHNNIITYGRLYNNVLWVFSLAENEKPVHHCRDHNEETDNFADLFYVTYAFKLFQQYNI